jgi:hypothetical protein
MSFWTQCTHAHTSPPDDLGDALCLTCGTKTRTTLTHAGLMDTFDTIFRDFGHARHSKRCVILEDRSFLCSDDCEYARARR